LLKIAPEYGYTYTSIQTVVPPEKDSANLQCRAPSSFRRVVTQNVQTNAPKLVNVGVKDLSQEADLANATDCHMGIRKWSRRRWGR